MGDLHCLLGGSWAISPILTTPQPANALLPVQTSWEECAARCGWRKDKSAGQTELSRLACESYQCMSMVDDLLRSSFCRSCTFLCWVPGLRSVLLTPSICLLCNVPLLPTLGPTFTRAGTTPPRGSLLLLQSYSERSIFVSF